MAKKKKKKGYWDYLGPALGVVGTGLAAVALGALKPSAAHAVGVRSGQYDSEERMRRVNQAYNANQSDAQAVAREDRADARVVQRENRAEARARREREEAEARDAHRRRTDRLHAEMRENNARAHRAEETERAREAAARAATLAHERSEARAANAAHRQSWLGKKALALKVLTGGTALAAAVGGGLSALGMRDSAATAVQNLAHEGARTWGEAAGRAVGGGFGGAAVGFGAGLGGSAIDGLETVGEGVIASFKHGVNFAHGTGLGDMADAYSYTKEYDDAVSAGRIEPKCETPLCKKAGKLAVPAATLASLGLLGLR